MKFPFVWRKAAEDETATWKAEADRQRRRAERAETTAATEVRARRQINALYSDLFDEHERTVRGNRRLCVQLQDAQSGASVEAQARRAADRIARLQKAVARGRAEAAKERANSAGLARQVKSLQKRLDDAVGLDAMGIRDSAPWQPGYVDKAKAAKEAS